MKSFLSSPVAKLLALAILIVVFVLLVIVRQAFITNTKISIPFLKEESVSNPNPTTEKQESDTFLPIFNTPEADEYGEIYSFTPNWDGSFINEEVEVKSNDGTILFTYYKSIDVTYFNQSGKQSQLRIPLVIRSPNEELGLIHFKNNNTPSDINALMESIESASKNTSGNSRKVTFTIVKDYEKFYTKNSSAPTGWLGNSVISYYSELDRKQLFLQFIDSGSDELKLLIPQQLQFYELPN